MKERKTDRRYATTKIPGEPGLSKGEIAKLVARTPALLPFGRRLDAEFFLRGISRQEDEVLDSIEGLEDLMLPPWNLG